MQTPTFNRGISLLIMVLIAVAIFSVIGWGQNPTVHRERINKILATLSAESFDDSVKNLATDELFSNPGFHTAPKFPQICLETMLSNRRCVKVIEHLRDMEQDERRKKLRELFAKYLEIQSTAIHTVLRHADDPTAPVNNQSMLGSQGAICAVMFATAESGDRQLLLEQFDQLDKSTEKIEERIKKNEKAHEPILIHVIRGNYTPDNRFQLNVLFLLEKTIANHKVLGQIERESVIAGLRRKPLQIAPWNSETTWFDLVGRPGLGANGVSEGGVNYTFYEDWTGSDLSHNPTNQQRLVKKFRELVAAQEK
ncbi:MAG: hypothetical protein SGJ20_00940 [Planctomycetota bacterium]|nr:hypothetical protein [Planctomycetota bacterium]